MYPYSTTATGLSTLAAGTTSPGSDADTFFANVINNWSVAASKNTAALLKTQDLQIAKVNGTSFPMAHKMTLAKFTLSTKSDVQKTQYYISGPASVADNNYLWYDELVSVSNSSSFNSETKPYLSSTVYYFIAKSNSAASTTISASATTLGDTSKTTADDGAKTNAWSASIPSLSTPNSYYDISPAAPSMAYITRTGYSLQVGDIYYSDGAVSRPDSKYNNKTTIGIIAYIANDAYTEKNYGGGHALVMSKFHDSSTRQWKTSNTDSPIPNIGAPMNHLVNDASGYYNCHTYLNSTTFPAAYYAMRHTLSYPTGKCTGWFLPAVGQWYKTFVSLGNMPASTFDMAGENDQVRGTLAILTTINSALSYFGTKNTHYHELLSTSARYWAAAEYTAERAYDWGFLNEPPSYYGINIGTDPNNKTISEYVRPFLAF
jgi:hypothetical protein